MSEWQDHREALAYFLRNETSLGCYTVDGDELARARAAMRYFARDDSLGKLLGDLEALERERDGLRVALDKMSLLRKEWVPSKAFDKIDKENAKLRAALEKIRNEEHEPDCPPVPGHTIAPGGHHCSCPQRIAREVLLQGEEAT